MSMSLPISFPTPVSTLLTVVGCQSETFSSMATQLKGSASRLGHMASSGNRVAVLKLAGMIVGACIVLYYLLKLIF